VAKKKTPEDLEWETIFNSISYHLEPHPKYIKNATVYTKYGKRIRLTGREFVEVMEQERMMDPEDALIESCKVTLDFEKLKIDIGRYASSVLKKASSRYKKSRKQTQSANKLRQPPVVKTQQKPQTPSSLS
jgi:hypothetical protein